MTPAQFVIDGTLAICFCSGAVFFIAGIRDMFGIRGKGKSMWRANLISEALGLLASVVVVIAAGVAIALLK